MYVRLITIYYIKLQRLSIELPWFFFSQNLNQISKSITRFPFISRGSEAFLKVFECFCCLWKEIPFDFNGLLSHLKWSPLKFTGLLIIFTGVRMVRLNSKKIPLKHVEMYTKCFKGSGPGCCPAGLSVPGKKPKAARRCSRGLGSGSSRTDPQNPKPATGLIQVPHRFPDPAPS